MKTIAQQLKIKEFPFIINDKSGKGIYYEKSNGYWNKREYNSSGNQIYFEDSTGYWDKQEYDSSGNQIYYENSYGYINDNRPKKTCNGKTVEIDGIKYELKQLKK